MNVSLGKKEENGEQAEERGCDTMKCERVRALLDELHESVGRKWVKGM